ncbi:caleosin domain protein [Rhizophagus clarus]|uniref:Caleosin domain protein n=1 Tax=Rhizophagus clarus TaxID=94130 RepID=A0A8H3MBK1_9GLOM|nr:caleosin domain protein [Rhizophagus clarus]
MSQNNNENIGNNLQHGPDISARGDQFIVQENKKNKKNERHQDNKNQDHNKNEQTDRSIFHKKDEQNSHKIQEKDIITEAKDSPITKERKVPKDLCETLGNAGEPRAIIAATKEKPNGTPGRSTSKSVLQQHVEFWDADHKGVISPLDTWRGFRKLGFSLVYSAIAVGVINGTLYKAKHGSDSETFDTEGRFVPEKFEEVFSKYDRDNKGGLSFNDIVQIIRGNANAFDPYGWIAASFEWGTLYFLCEKDGIVSKEDLRSCFDGTLFYRMEQTEERRKKGVPIIKSSVNININSAKEE